jgi:hypothetical protein
MISKECDNPRKEKDIREKAPFSFSFDHFNSILFIYSHKYANMFHSQKERKPSKNAFSFIISSMFGVIFCLKYDNISHFMVCLSARSLHVCNF